MSRFVVGEKVRWPTEPNDGTYIYGCVVAVVLPRENPDVIAQLDFPQHVRAFHRTEIRSDRGEGYLVEKLVRLSLPNIRSHLRIFCPDPEMMERV